MTHDAHIAIVGAGIGGLTAALCFRHLGYRVDVFEQSPELKEVGAGIQISPNALRVFEKLGLDQSVKRTRAAGAGDPTDEPCAIACSGAS